MFLLLSIGARIVAVVREVTLREVTDSTLALILVCGVFVGALLYMLYQTIQDSDGADKPNLMQNKSFQKPNSMRNRL